MRFIFVFLAFFMCVGHNSYAASELSQINAQIKQTSIILSLKKDDEAVKLYEQAAGKTSVRPAALPMLANARLKAAELHLKRHSYSDAGLQFLTFAEKYPDHADTVSALYKAVYAYFLADRRDEMKYCISKIIILFLHYQR